VPDEHHEYAVSAQEEDPDALIHSFRRFLAWRARRPALRYGTIHPLPTPSPLIGFERRYGDDRILAFFNLSDAPATADLSGFAGVELLEESGFAAVIEGRYARLPPHGVFFATIASAQPNRATAALACG
jgi:alpha-glucosidase